MRNLFFLGMSGALSFFVHPFVAFPLLVVLAVVLFRPRPDRSSDVIQVVGRTRVTRATRAERRAEWI